MCFYFKQSKDALTLAKRFKVKVNEDDSFVSGDFNAFTFPRVPVITDKVRDRISGFTWGLIPDNGTDISIRKFTLNGRIETLNTVKSYRNYEQNRCLIIADGFYEWGDVVVLVKSEEEVVKSGKRKEKSGKCKYLITLPDESLFAFAGIYSPNGTFTLLTTTANKLLAEIHNTKLRMPVILRPDQEKMWLDNAEIKNFQRPYGLGLSAKLIDTGYDFKKNSILDDNLIF
ncbi:MAG: SOS response-associated peptidase [Rikenellaceae bacterium]|nr:SOS response-associated peptidase [Rikenellaceae bacterium]